MVDLSSHGGTPRRVPSLALVVASLSSQRSLSQAPLSQEQAETNPISLCTSYQVALSQAQTVADLGLPWNLFEEVLEPTYLVASFKPHQSTTQPVPQMTPLKGRLGWHRSPAKVTPEPWG